MEQDVPGPVLQCKEDSQKDACINYCCTSRPQSLKTDVSGVSLGTGLLWVRADMNWGCDEVPDSATLQTNHLCQQKPIEC